MASYLIYRHGSNAANQSMTPVAAVAIVDAENEEAAVKAASDSDITCYNNQFFEAVAEDDLTEEQVSDWNDVLMDDACRRETGLSSIVL